MSNDYAVKTGEALINQYEKIEEQAASKKRTAFDAKNYLNVRLGPNEASKKLRIRVLPFDPETNEIFHKVYMHSVRVNKEVSPSGWKKFICPTGNHFGDKCPFCEASALAKEKKYATNVVSERNTWGDIEYQNRRRDMWVIRCIERGHEEDGVKFWLFNSSQKKDGIYDKMFNLFKERWDSAMSKGKVSNIFDIYEGKDLIISISKDSNDKSVYQVTDDEDKSPLSDSEEQIQAWLNDDKKWTDVYVMKPYEYMQIILDNGVPVFDKESNKYVDKNELKLNEQVAEAKRMEEALTEDTSGIDVTEKPNFDNEAEEDLPF